MKTKFFAAILIICLLLSYSFPGLLFADTGITVKGTIFYWNLEEGARIDNTYGNFDNIPGGRYLPARNLYIEVEFDTLRVSDVKIFTDESGNFEIFVDKNPWWGTWNVDIEVIAWAELDYNAGEPIAIKCFEDSEDIFQYNGQTGERSVGKNQTLDFNVYIGGPGNNIKDWWDADISSLWDGGAGDGKNHVASFFIADIITDGFDWLTDRAASAADINRTTCVLYPSDETGITIEIGSFEETFLENNIDKYNGLQPPPGTGHIHIVPKFLWPGEMRSFDFPIGNRWKHLRSTLLHEYGHKVMHDLYWMMPARLDFWNTEEVHDILSCNDPEQGWKEGWAEFFSAAVQNQQTVNGEKNGDAHNIEHSYHPNALYPKGELNSAELGEIGWHKDILTDESKELIRDYNEGENASVLWDIFDDKGWEYLPETEQQTKPLEWDRNLMWYDMLEDNNLEKIWSILKDHAPDCLMDEEDADNPLKIEDSFWYYWLDKYKENNENVHALKTILFNRGISSSKKPESSPSIVTKSLDIKNKKLNLEIKELNPEDQQYLYYNIAFRAPGSETTEYMFASDQPLNSLPGSWIAGKYATSIALPPPGAWENLWLVVHDSMLPVFEDYVNSETNESEGTEDDTGVQKKKLRLEEVGVAAVTSAFDVVVSGDYAYIADWEDGLVTVDISNPQNPLIVSVYDQRSEENSGKWYSAKALALKDNLIYLATHTGALVIIDVSDPYKPEQAGYLDGEQSLEGITVSGNYAYAAADRDGLYIYDISKPGLLEKVSVIDTPDYAFEVELSGSLAYVAGGGAICAVDISDPENPFLLGSSPVYLPKGVAIGKSGYVYASDYRGGLHVIDYSDPSNPVKVNSLAMIKGGFNMVIDNSCLYVANSSKGMSVYDISVAGSPQEIFVFNPKKSRGQSRNVYVQEEYAYLVANRGGLIIFKIIEEQ